MTCHTVAAVPSCPAPTARGAAVVVVVVVGVGRAAWLVVRLAQILGIKALPEVLVDLLLVVGVSRKGVDRQLELDLRARVLLDEGGGGRGALGRLDGSYDLGGPVHGCFWDLRRRAFWRGVWCGVREGHLSAIWAPA